MRNNYLGMLLTMLAFPVVIGIMDKSVISAVDISMPIYLFAGIAFALRTTWAMRNKGTLVLDSALPVSKGERFTFMLFNLAVAYPLACFAVAALSMLIVAPFSMEGTIAEAMNDYFLRFAFEWAVYVVVQIVASASLLINLMTRRSLIVAYIGAIVGVIAFIVGASYAGVQLANALYDMEKRRMGRPNGCRHRGQCRVGTMDNNRYLCVNPHCLLRLSLFGITSSSSKVVAYADAV